MGKVYLFATALCLCLTWAVSGQSVSLNSNQAPPLKADAGNDVVVYDQAPVAIGGHPTATDGYGGYVYLWTPSAGLNDPTSPNPLANPAVSTTYTVTITDAHNCSVLDEVYVRVTGSGSHLSPDRILLRVFPNPAMGRIRMELDGYSGPLILKVINATGVVVHQTDLESSGYYREELETASLPRGSYFVVIVSNNKVISKPLVLL